MLTDKSEWRSRQIRTTTSSRCENALWHSLLQRRRRWRGSGRGSFFFDCEDSCWTDSLWNSNGTHFHHPDQISIKNTSDQRNHVFEVLASKLIAPLFVWSGRRNHGFEVSASTLSDTLHDGSFNSRIKNFELSVWYDTCQNKQISMSKWIAQMDCLVRPRM